MKKILSLILVISMFATLSLVCFNYSSAASSDPSETYVKQVAANEDPTLDMWFEHSTVKVHQEDHVPTGMDTYSIYMARNEMQGAHVILYAPDENKENLTVSYSQFTAMDGSGATIETSFMYEFYINVQDVATDDIIEFTAENSIIRNGIIPEAMAPVESLTKGAGTFTIQAGNTQALYIKLKTDLDTPSGWYSGTFDILNSNGEAIKTATVFAYVWNFTIPVENHLQSGIYISYSTDAVYKMQYDFLLENRLQGFDLPGNLNSSNPYLDDPRVTAFRIAQKAGGSYLANTENTVLKAAYDDLSTRSDWETLKDKTYVYTIDEPTSQQWVNYVQEFYSRPTYYRPTIDDCESESIRVNSCWPDANTLVVFCEDFPYPNTYSKELLKQSDGTYLTAYNGSSVFDGVKDGIQAAMEKDVAKIWCPKVLMFTPHDVLVNAGYTGSYGNRYFGVRSMNGVTSGFDVSRIPGNYFDWDTLYGSFPQRFFNYQSQKASEGTDVKLWWYACGKNGDYTYCYHNIENTGLQTELMFWQNMQEHTTGYLYYGSNLYEDSGEIIADVNPTAYVQGTNTEGVLVDNIWRCNPCYRDGHHLYGNGLLFYERSFASLLKLKGVNILGTIRLEEIRDGIEDYEMLWLYREKFGEEAVQAYVKRVSNNVTSYLTMPSFDRSQWPSSMRNEDVFAQIRIELGNTLETAYGECAHEWDEGVVVKEATYDECGEKLHTCALCGETYIEETPVLPALIGDVDGNGQIDAIDYKTLKAYVNGTLDSTKPFYTVNADIDGSGQIDGIDLKKLKTALIS